VRIDDGMDGDNYTITFVAVHTGVITESAVDQVHSLTAGWNLISVLVLADDMSVASLFPDIQAIYAWDPDGELDYVPSTIEVSRGYQVSVLADRTITVTGEPVQQWSEELREGWSLIGSIWSGAVDVADLTDDTDGCLQESAVYRWNAPVKMYEWETQIQPGHGYRTAFSETCRLTMGPLA